MARSARQVAASRRNLVIARSKRRRRPSKKTVKRVAKTVGIVGLVAGTAYVGSRNKKVSIASHTMASSVRSAPKSVASPHRVRGKTFNKANFPHTPEAKAHANIKYKHSSGFRKPISSAEAQRRTNTYVNMRTVSGKKISSMERSSVLNKYRKQTV